MTPFDMNSSQLRDNVFNDELFEGFMKLGKLSINSLRELHEVKQEREFLVIQLSESLALINSLKSENTMLIKTVESLENEWKESKNLLNKLSSDNLKSMLCVQKDVSNKPSMIVDDLDASNFEIKSLFVKPMKVDEVKVNMACLDNCENSCLNNYVKSKSKDHLGKQTQAKFVPTCHHCGIIGHIKPNCYLLKSQRPWNKQDAPKK